MTQFEFFEQTQQFRAETSRIIMLSVCKTNSPPICKPIFNQLQEKRSVTNTILKILQKTHETMKGIY